MPFYEYKEVLKRIRAVAPHIEVHDRRGKGSHVMLFDPDTKHHYPLPHGGNDKRMIAPGMQSDIVRRFGLPKDTFR